MDPFGRSLCVRTAAVIAASLCTTIAVVVLTDEAASTAGMRLSRVAALGPLLSCVGVLATAAHARQRGEISALVALGAPPWEAARGAAFAGYAFGVLCLMALVCPWADSSSLFPRFVPAIDWVVDSSGAVARGGGLAVFSDGSFEFVRGGASAETAEPGRFSALVCFAPLAIACPPWAVTPMSVALRVAGIATTAMLLIVALHLIAAGRASAWIGLAACLPLVATTINERRPRRPSRLQP